MDISLFPSWYMGGGWREVAADYSTVTKFQLGDVSAYEALMREENVRVLGYIRRFLRSSEVVADVFQETCLRVWRSREQLRDPAKFRSWLFQIVRSAVYEQLRSRDWPPEVEFYGHWDEADAPPDPAHGPREKAWRGQLRRILNEEIARLDKSSREMVVLRFVGGLNLREISEVLNAPHGTVCYKMNQAMREMRSRLEAQGITLAVFQEGRG